MILNKRYSLRVTAPVSAVGSYEVGFASFGPLASTSNFTSNQIVVVNDGVAPAGGSLTDGCELPFVNAAAIVGKVALIDRGGCGFAVKAANAQSSGAIGVVIANNAPGVIDMGGVPPITITIPSVMVSLADGSTIKSGAPATGGLIVDPVFLAGADNAGRLRLYSPTTVAGGSTFSHVDTAASPNALMEPFDTPEVQSQYFVDVTPAIFEDIGWQLNPGNGKIGRCDTTVDAVANGGLIIGANVVAWSGVCATQAKGNKAIYNNCMFTRSNDMRRENLISTAQYGQVYRCAILNTP